MTPYATARATLRLLTEEAVRCEEQDDDDEENEEEQAFAPLPIVGGVAQAMLGEFVRDEATVTGQSPTGTVSFFFFTNGNCAGFDLSTSTPFDTEPLSSGVALSSVLGPLAAGDYSFLAHYNGDSSNAESTSACEPLHVAKAPTTTVTTVCGEEEEDEEAHDDNDVDDDEEECEAENDEEHNDDHDDSQVGDDNDEHHGENEVEEECSEQDDDEENEGASFPLGTSVHDCARVRGAVPGFPLTGTVTFHLFSTSDCKGSFSSETVALGSNLRAESTPTMTLGAGMHSFQATFAPDGGNYFGSTSDCEPFRILPAPTEVCEDDNEDGHDEDDDECPEVDDDQDHHETSSWSLPLGASVHDGATVRGAVEGFPITGTITYKFFKNGECDGSPLSTQKVAVGIESSPTGPLATGSYSYLAIYSGSANYLGSRSACESFTVEKALTTIGRTVHDPFHHDITGSSVLLGTAVHDSATVSGTVGTFSISTGAKVTYSFFRNGDCSGSAESTVTVSVGTESPAQTLGAGAYGYIAVYSGNANYLGSAGGCEPFTVLPAPTTVATTIHDSAHKAITAPVPVGATVHDSSIVSGAVGAFSISTGATVTYYFFTDGTCAGGVLASASSTQTVSVGTESSAQTLGAGAYGYIAVYSGNANYLGSAGACEPLTVKQLATRTISFWNTYLTFTTTVWSSVVSTDICGKTVKNVQEVMGAFYSSITKKTDGSSRTTLAAAKMALVQQYLAAVLNRQAFGTDDGGKIAAAQAACASGVTANIQAATANLDAYNKGGSAYPLPPGVNPGTANSSGAQAVANQQDPASPTGITGKKFWNTL